MIRSHSDNYFTFHNSLHCGSLINVAGSSVQKSLLKREEDLRTEIENNLT